MLRPIILCQRNLCAIIVIKYKSLLIRNGLQLLNGFLWYFKKCSIHITFNFEYFIISMKKIISFYINLKFGKYC